MCVVCMQSCVCDREKLYVCVVLCACSHVCVTEIVSVCVCCVHAVVCVCDRNSECVLCACSRVCATERNSECVCVCACVCRKLHLRGLNGSPLFTTVNAIKRRCRSTVELVMNHSSGHKNRGYVWWGVFCLFFAW